MKVWSKQYIFIKVPHVKKTLFEQCCLSRDLQLCCCAHLNINNKYGKDTFPCGLSDLPMQFQQHWESQQIFQILLYFIWNFPFVVCVNPHDLSSELRTRKYGNSSCRAGWEKMGYAIRQAWAEETDVRRKKPGKQSKGNCMWQGSTCPLMDS